MKAEQGKAQAGMMWRSDLKEATEDATVDHLSTLRHNIASFPGEIGLAVRSDDGKEFFHQADAPWEPASVVKLLFLCAAYDTLDLDRRVTITKIEKAAGWGVLQFLKDSPTLSLRDLATLMIVISDNVATDLILSHLPPETVDELIRSRGLVGTSVRGGFRTSFQPLAFSGKNIMTAGDTLTLLRYIRTRPELRAVLCQQQDKSILHRYLPRGVARFSKSGEGSNVRNDCGFVEWEGGGAIISLFSKLPEPIGTLERLADTDSRLAHIAHAAYRWAREG